MSVRTRLVLTLLGIALLVSLPASYAVSQLGAVSDIAGELRGRHAASLRSLGRLQTSLSELDRFLRSYVVEPSDEARQRVHGRLADVRYQLSRLGERGYAVETRRAGAQLDALEDSIRRIETLLGANRLDAATALLEQVKPAFDRLHNSIDQVAESIDASSARDVELARAKSSAARDTVLIALVISLLAAIALGLWTVRALLRPIRNLRESMVRVADGDLDAPRDLPYERTDELGDLSRAFRAMTAQLAELDRLKAEFISMASHDLKTPINVISGYSELMEEGIFGELNQKQREVLTSIRDQTQTLTRLVTQLLDISRIEAGGFRIEPTDVVLPDLLLAVERTFEALARQKQIDFKVELADSAPRRLSLDPDRIRNEVIGNLLSNAFKFTPQGGKIRVRTREEDGRLHLEVEDTGVGIPEDQLEHIFDKYYQVGSHARSVGSGLGLAIAREIIEAHDGELTVESQPGVGSSFRFWIPVRHKARAEDARAAGRRA